MPPDSERVNGEYEEESLGADEEAGAINQTELDGLVFVMFDARGLKILLYLYGGEMFTAQFGDTAAFEHAVASFTGALVDYDDDSNYWLRSYSGFLAKADQISFEITSETLDADTGTYAFCVRVTEHPSQRFIVNMGTRGICSETLENWKELCRDFDMLHAALDS